MPRYLVVLGKRVLGAWSLATSTRARRRAAAGSLVSALFTILTRSACARWASQVATATQETEQTAVALEYCYDRSLRRHLRAWSSLVRERRILRRFAMLFMRGWKMAEAATAFRLWRRRVAQIRDAALRRRRIAVRSCFVCIVAVVDEVAILDGLLSSATCGATASAVYVQRATTHSE